MFKSVYDPNEVEADVYDMDNMTEGSDNKILTNSERNKLSGIEANATANDTDANLRDRATHTGTQTASTISDFNNAVSNNTDVEANTSARHTHSNKQILDNTTAEFTTAKDNKLSGIEAGAQVNEVTSGDIANFETTTQLNARDVANRNRANHTGTQAASTITGLASVATSGSYSDLSGTPAPTFVNFDANNNASAARPSVPATTTVAWFNVPSKPTNLGDFDIWEDAS